MRTKLITILINIIICSCNPKHKVTTQSKLNSFIIHQTDELEYNLKVIRINLHNLIQSQMHISIDDINIQDHKRGSISNKINYKLKDNISLKNYIDHINHILFQNNKIYFNHNKLYFSIPYNKENAIKIFEINSQEGYINIKDLYSLKILKCPIDFSDLTNPIYHAISVKRTDLDRYTQYINYDKSELMTKISFKNHKLIWNISCNFTRISKNIEDQYVNDGYTFNAQITVALNFSYPIFILKNNIHNTEFNPLIPKYLTYYKNHGTKFFRVQENVNIKKNPILKWNLLQNQIVIDDILTDTGEPLENFKYGSYVKKALKQIKQDLLIKWFELGNKIVLKSEHPNKYIYSNVNIHYISQDHAHTSGLAGMLINKDSGEISYAALQLSFDKSMDAIRQYYTKLQEIGILKNAEKSIEMVILNIVAHEFGHILGLTHNLLGHNCTKEFGTYYVSIMSYIYPQIIPPEYSTYAYSFPYGIHDILSLKYLYAELLNTEEPNYIEKLRTEILKELLKIPYAETPEEIKFTFNPKENVTRCWTVSEHPDLIQFKKINTDFLNTIQKIFISTYKKPMPIFMDY